MGEKNRKEIEKSIFLASSQTAPCSLSSFDTHARCSPKRKALDLDDLTEKIEDCEQSTAFSKGGYLLSRNG